MSEDLFKEDAFSSNAVKNSSYTRMSNTMQKKPTGRHKVTHLFHKNQSVFQMSLLITPGISAVPMCPCVSHCSTAADRGCCWYLPVAAQSSSVTVSQLHQRSGLVYRFTRQCLLERLPAALSDWSKMTAHHTCCFEHLKKTPSASGSNLCRRVFFQSCMRLHRRAQHWFHNNTIQIPTSW